MRYSIILTVITSLALSSGTKDDERINLTAEAGSLATSLPTSIPANDVLGQLGILEQELSGLGHVSDLPSIISAKLATASVEFAAAITDAVLPAQVSLAEAELNMLVPAIQSKFNGYIAALPQTLAISALPSYLHSNLPAISSALPGIEGSALSEFSVYLTQIAGGQTPKAYHTGAGLVPTAAVAITADSPLSTSKSSSTSLTSTRLTEDVSTSKSGSITAASTSVTITSTSAASVLKGEILAVFGAVAGVILL